MVAHGRLRQPECRDELARAHGLVARRDDVDDLHAGRVGQRLEERGRRSCLVVGQCRRAQRAATLDRVEQLHIDKHRNDRYRYVKRAAASAAAGDLSGGGPDEHPAPLRHQLEAATRGARGGRLPAGHARVPATGARRASPSARSRPTSGVPGRCRVVAVCVQAAQEAGLGIEAKRALPRLGAVGVRKAHAVLPGRLDDHALAAESRTRARAGATRPRGARTGRGRPGALEEAAARAEPAVSVPQLLASRAERDSGHADASEEHELLPGTRCTDQVIGSQNPREPAIGCRIPPRPPASTKSADARAPSAST